MKDCNLKKGARIISGKRLNKDDKYYYARHIKNSLYLNYHNTIHYHNTVNTTIILWNIKQWAGWPALFMSRYDIHIRYYVDYIIQVSWEKKHSAITVNVRSPIKTIIFVSKSLERKTLRIWPHPLGNCLLLDPLPTGISDALSGRKYKPHPGMDECRYTCNSS